MPRPYVYRNPPVLTSRFRSKGGDRYQRGYQYRFPEDFHITLGPWAGVWPLGNRNTPQDTLQELRDGVIRDGALYALWSETSLSAGNTAVVGDYEFGILDQLIRVTFRVDNGVQLSIDLASADAFTTIITTFPAVPDNDARIVAAAWQNKIYFSWAEGTALYAIEVDTNDLMNTGPAGEVPNTPAGIEFMLLMANRLLIVRRDGDSYVIEWTVDSDPEDFLGIGAGSAVLEGQLGRPQGFEPYVEAAMLLTSKGAMLISPTGVNIPAFRLTRRADISGVLYTYATAEFANRLFYIGTDRRARMFDGREQMAGVGERAFLDPTRLFVSERLDLVAFTDRQLSETIWLDPQINRWVSTQIIGFDWISDGPGPGPAGNVHGTINDNGDTIEHTFNLDAQPSKPPFIKTGRYYIGREVWIDRIDLIRTDLNFPIAPTMELEKTIDDNINDLEDFSLAAENTQDQGTYITYHVNAPAKSIQLRFSVEDVPEIPGGPFLSSTPTLEGNVPVDETNPLTGEKADPNVQGNAAITPEAFVYTGLEIDAEGNLTLQIREDLWSPNLGVERIEVYGSEQEAGRF